MSDQDIFMKWYPKGMPDYSRHLPVDELNEHQINLFMMYPEFKRHLLRVRWMQFIESIVDAVLSFFSSLLRTITRR